MENIFQIFGSKTSLDFDIMVFVSCLNSTEENHVLVKQLNIYYGEKYFPNKKINCNLAVLHNYQIIDVFKGTIDECNNSLYTTYNLHKQYHINQIEHKYDRFNNYWYHLKLKRVFRFILSFYSRVPELRSIIKPSLKGDFSIRLNALKLIDFKKETEFKKKENTEDIYKTFAFQLAQMIGLNMFIEIYTKEDAIKHFPKLEPFIMRKPFNSLDLIYLDSLLKELIIIGEKEIIEMESLIEEIKN